ncbi:MAG TPA: matrixin family metalloprotease, partial [Dermatophilaceae bacterium]|nr:matrixin family metalloprotease [Dermatophilaceae bacterium]HOU99768.1 matrixin family metalloprotease [Dermatophilaceae bacterium]HQH89587.1 matrixin family metalloprotease [Dermatophilaceae bacterium]
MARSVGEVAFSDHPPVWRGRGPLALLVCFAVAVSTLVGVPSAAAASPAPASTAAAAAPQSAAGAPVLRALPDVGAKPLRQPVTTTTHALPAAAARARIDAALAQARRQADGQRAVARAQAAQSAQAAQAAQAAKVRQVQDAKAAADAKIQEALQALARALSTSQCTTVGGTNGTAASVSCPLAGGSSATVTGGGSATPTPLLATSAAAHRGFGAANGLGSADLAAAFESARADWEAWGADTRGITVSLAHLPGAMLGSTLGRHIEIDADAAGWGWATVDLRTVLRHEIGHALGLSHADSGVMAATLAPGVSVPVLGADTFGPRLAAQGHAALTLSGGIPADGEPTTTDPGTTTTDPGTTTTDPGTTTTDPGTTTTDPGTTTTDP